MRRKRKSVRNGERERKRRKWGITGHEGVMKREW